MSNNAAIPLVIQDGGKKDKGTLSVLAYLPVERAPLVHWADVTARKIIGQRGEKDSYTLAAGISPSGRIHLGNFREVITVDLVARALGDRGKGVRFLLSWDDFDSLRKIPANLPEIKKMEDYLHRALVDVPDPYGKEDSYALHHERAFESELAKVGVGPTPLYQAQKYRNREYAEQILRALSEAPSIRRILNRHRRKDLGEHYLPVVIYCTQCHRATGPEERKGEFLHYCCGHCGHRGKENIKKSQRLKLPWRVDWPMRWAFEGVDFEPGGKDHSSEGGSYTTAKEIVGLFEGQPPVYLQYDFVGIKGAGGKMSSSRGNLVTLSSVLDIFEPEIIRWFFVCQRPNVDFSLSFDIDVIKTYEAYDRMERVAYGLEEASPKKRGLIHRTIELSQLDRGALPPIAPYRAPFRHLTNILQIHGGDIESALEDFKEHIRDDRDRRAFHKRAHCALHWLAHYAPERFKFTINDSPQVASDVSPNIRPLFTGLRDYLTSCPQGELTSTELHERIYGLIHDLDLGPAEAFKALYRALISKDEGPKLAEFMLTLKRDKLLALLSPGPPR